MREPFTCSEAMLVLSRLDTPVHLFQIMASNDTNLHMSNLVQVVGGGRERVSKCSTLVLPGKHEILSFS
jgi:hypothetical protein